jgi:tRNA(fMet)-specific endonuclease VapC
MYLLDTDIIIYSMKGHPLIRQKLTEQINAVMRISMITLNELYYGAYKSQQVSTNLAKIKMLENAFEAIPVNYESAEIFGLLKAQLESQGNRLDDFDLLIAATAMAHNLTLVSNNLKHFQRIDGLKIETWL